MSNKSLTVNEMYQLGRIDETYQPGRVASIILLVVLSLLFFISQMEQSVLASVLELIKKDLGLSDAQAGSLQSFLYFSTSVLSIPCAMAVDRWSRRKAISLMAIFWSLASLSTGLGSRFINLAASRFCTGIGESGYVPGATTWISLAFSKENRAKVLGLFSMSAPFGMAFGAAFGGIVASATGSWRTPFFILAIPGVLLGIAVFFLPDYATIKTKGEKILSLNFFREAASLFRIKTLIFHWLGAAMTLFLVFSLMSWFPTLIMRGYGVGTAEAGKIVGIILAGGLVSAPIGGLLADVWQRRNRRGRMYFAGTIMILTAISKFSLFYTLGISLKLTIIIGFIDGILTPMVLPLIFSINADVSPAKLRATCMGLNTLIVFLLGTMWGPLVMGVLSDSFGAGMIGLSRAGMICCFAGLLASMFYFIGSKFYPADSEKVKDEVMVE